MTHPTPPSLPDPFADPPAHRTDVAAAANCRLHFEPLRPDDRGVDIPCDDSGRVAIDALGERLRNNYFFARACIGRLFAAPVLQRRTQAC